MPVKRRISKRRSGQTGAYETWFEVLVTGCDLFGELAEFGIATDETGEPDKIAARAAWIDFGARILAEFNPGDFGRSQPWALEYFGDPIAATKGKTDE